MKIKSLHNFLVTISVNIKSNKFKKEKRKKKYIDKKTNTSNNYH